MTEPATKILTKTKTRVRVALIAGGLMLAAAATGGTRGAQMIYYTGVLNMYSDYSPVAGTTYQAGAQNMELFSFSAYADKESIELSRLKFYFVPQQGVNVEQLKKMVEKVQIYQKRYNSGGYGYGYYNNPTLVRIAPAILPLENDKRHPNLASVEFSIFPPIEIKVESGISFVLKGDISVTAPSGNFSVQIDEGQDVSARGRQSGRSAVVKVDQAKGNWLKVEGAKIPVYNPSPTSALTRGQSYNFSANITGAIPNAPIQFFLQRPDGSMKYDNFNPCGMAPRSCSRNPITDANGNFYGTSDNQGAFLQLTLDGQNGTWASWVTVGGVASNKVQHTVAGAVVSNLVNNQEIPASEAKISFSSNKCCSGPASNTFTSTGQYRAFYDPKIKYKNQELDYVIKYSDDGAWCKIYGTSLTGAGASNSSNTKTGWYVEGVKGKLYIRQGQYSPQSTLRCKNIGEPAATVPTTAAGSIQNVSVGGSSFKVGDTLKISWTMHGSVGPAGRSIVYLYQGDAQKLLIKSADTPSANTYNLTIPETLNITQAASNYKIRVISADNLSIFGDSNLFTIEPKSVKPSITVLSPNGGEKWRTGEIHRISWASNGVKNITIYLYDDRISGSGAIVNYPVPDNKPIAANQGYYDWTILDNVLQKNNDGKNFRIIVQDTGDYSISDKSDAPFSIVAVPTQNSYIYDGTLVGTGPLTPRCLCDKSDAAKECPQTFDTNDAPGTFCYDNFSYDTWLFFGTRKLVNKYVAQGSDAPPAAGNYSVSLDSSTPAGKLSTGGAVGVPTTVLNFKAVKEDIQINKVKLALTHINSSARDLSQVYLYDGSTLLARGTLGVGNATGGTANASEVFVLSNPLKIPANSSKLLTIKADIAPITTANTIATAGHSIIINYVESEGVGMNSGLLIKDNKATTGANLTFIYRSVPTVSTQSLSSNVLANGNNTISRFKVAADSKGDIDLYNFNLSLLINQATLTDLALYDVTNGVEAKTPVAISQEIISGKTIFHATFGAPGNGKTPASAKPAGGGGFMVVAAGAYKIFELRATVTGVTSGSYVKTKILGDASGGFSSSANQVLARGGNFIWSDWSQSNHSINSTDWQSGYLVNGLPDAGLAEQILTK